MSLDRKALQHALERRGVTEWIVFERDQELAIVDEAAPRLRRSERRTRWQLVVHDDSSDGRGTARVQIDGVDGDADAIVIGAVAVARAATGPAWTSAPQGAPARVALIDDALAKHEPLAIADAVLDGMHRPAGATVSATASGLRETVTAIARGGFHASWSAALLHVDALVTVGDRALRVTREARRPTSLDLDAALADAAADLQLLATAGEPAPGPCAVVLRADAMLDGGLGVWATFAHQADAVVERQGLTRYRERAPIAAGADQVGEPLSIASDGALDFGVRSAPLGDDGDAVRKFGLVERGVAVGLGLSPREASVRGRDPNGGVRNLVVAVGSWDGAIDAGRARVLEVRRLRDLSIDPYTGDARLEVALGIEHGSGATRAFTGGTLRVDLIAALARARRAQTIVRRGAYVGPSAIWLDDAELLA